MILKDHELSIIPENILDCIDINHEGNDAAELAVYEDKIEELRAALLLLGCKEAYGDQLMTPNPHGIVYGYGFVDMLILYDLIRRTL